MMKYLVLTALLLILTSMQVPVDKKTLLCHKWIEFAFKGNSDAGPHLVTIDIARECVFKKSGAYEEVNNDDDSKSTGNWFFNPDKTKMEFALTNINGLKIPPLPESTRRYNIVILRLTKDTLIYGQESYNSKDKVYGRDDWYFVKE